MWLARMSGMDRLPGWCYGQIRNTLKNTSKRDLLFASAIGCGTGVGAQFGGNKDLLSTLTVSVLAGAAVLVARKLFSKAHKPTVLVLVEEKRPLHELAFEKACEMLCLIDNISYEPLEDPVVDGTGQTEGRQSLEEWFVQHTTSPVTRAELPLNAAGPDRRLVPNKLVSRVLGHLRTQTTELSRNVENTEVNVDEVAQAAIRSLHIPRFSRPVIVAEAFPDFEEGETYEETIAKEGQKPKWLQGSSEWRLLGGLVNRADSWGLVKRVGRILPNEKVAVMQRNFDDMQ